MTIEDCISLITIVLFQDVATAIFMAYAAKQFDGGHWYFSGSSLMKNHLQSVESRYSEGMSNIMGSFSLALAACVCLGLVAYRMIWGDDHGNSSSSADADDRKSRMQRVLFNREARSNIKRSRSSANSHSL
jgi:hypothetical protein